jgi:hypothetical protein
MANTKFPLKLNGINFQVNPTNLSVSKPIVKGSLSTQSGVRFQIWYNQPEVLTISGLSTGQSAYAELQFLKQNYEITNTQNISTLFYKTKNYRGFIDSIEVGHSIDRHQRWPYTIQFQLIQGEQFNIQDFALQPSTSALGQLTNLLEQNINAPIARANQALGSVLGKII